MKTLIIDHQLRLRFDNFAKAMELRDQDGLLVGHFVPDKDYMCIQTEMAMAACPYTEEQIQEARKQQSGMALSDFWKKMGVTEPVTVPESHQSI